MVFLWNISRPLVDLSCLKLGYGKSYFKFYMFEVLIVVVDDIKQ